MSPTDLCPDEPPPYAVVVFDCDSTLSAIEGIDELASPDARREIEALTNRAMTGELPLEAVYGARLERIAPSRADVAEIAALYAREAVPRARETIAALQSLGKTVAVVSGGLYDAVEPFARTLGVDSELVFAVPLVFDAAGNYAGYDDSSPLTRADGKREVVESLRRRFGPAVLVGDGMTDLAVAGVAARFVAFAGVVARPAVLATARLSVHDRDLAAVLPHLLTGDELARLDPPLAS